MNENKEVKAPVPFYVYEATVDRQERHIKRLIIALIVSVLLLFGTNAAWLYYESCFDTISYSQDGEGINNVNYGEQGALSNGAESENQDGEEPQAGEGN